MRQVRFFLLGAEREVVKAVFLALLHDFLHDAALGVGVGAEDDGGVGRLAAVELEKPPLAAQGIAQRRNRSRSPAKITMSSLVSCSTSGASNAASDGLASWLLGNLIRASRSASPKFKRTMKKAIN
ncbi:MAG: hypothetical protein WDZ48_05170 [Pirellulales bacterium]